MHHPGCLRDIPFDDIGAKLNDKFPALKSNSPRKAFFLGADYPCGTLAGSLNKINGSVARIHVYWTGDAKIRDRNPPIKRIITE